MAAEDIFVDYIANNKLLKHVEGRGAGESELLTCNFPGGTEKMCENPNSV
jgi:hypothetical protein